MEFGVHLPLADLGQGLTTLEDLHAYTATAARLGFDMVSANDHIVWKKPWLDGVTTLSSVIGNAGEMALATSVALPAVRHPVVLAKALVSLSVLSNRPVIAGLGPGSSPNSAGPGSTRVCGWCVPCSGENPSPTESTTRSAD